MTLAIPDATAPAAPPAHSAGTTVWFTGLPSAGKTTLAHAVAARLREHGRRVEVLDGDAVRAHLCADLGFTRADREKNIARIGFLARLLARNGVLVLAAVIAPYERARAAVRAEHVAEGVDYLEVYVSTPVEVCSARDVKGLYAKQRAGQISGLTGVDDVYEAPRDAELSLDTQQSTVDDSVAAVLSMLDGKGAL